MYYTSHYKIDFEKVKTLEDVIRILKVLDVAFEPYTKGLDEIKDLIKEEPKGGGVAVMD
jgi:hypothetical protein